MRYFTLSLLFVCSFLIGCGGDSVSSRVAAYNKENVQKAGTLYTIYSSLNGFTGPASVEEMKEFVISNPNATKRAEFVGMDVSRLDDYLVGRDGEPLKFRWSVKTGPLGPPYPICFEVTGVDGVRLVGVSGGRIEECEDDDEYEDMLNGKYRSDAERYSPGTEGPAGGAEEE